MMDMRRFLNQHDRARQLLLEGESAPELNEHVAECAVCGTLAARLTELDRLIRTVPEPRPELLGRLLRPGRVPAGPAESAGRIEMLWPTDAGGGSQSPHTALRPLVLAVEADRFTPDVPDSRNERFIIVGRHPIMVGRGPDMDVPIWDRSVSRMHAQIDWRDGAWLIRDLESMNGIKVNGTRLANSHVATLKPGDLIELGPYARVTVRSLLPAVEPAGVVREIHRLLAWAAQPARSRGRDQWRHEELRARLMGLREETARLREQVSSMAGQEAEAFPMVYETLTNMLDLIEHEALP